MRVSLVLMTLLLITPTLAHTGDNHTEEQLETDAHQRGDDFQFVRGDYPIETKYIVIAEMVLVAFLLAASVNHYRKKESD